jgi:excisionase family DNA binding protein
MTVTSPHDPLLLDVMAVAELLGCSDRHVRRLAAAGKMPAPVRLGALVRWPRAALEAWLHQGCPAMTATAQGGNNERQ